MLKWHKNDRHRMGNASKMSPHESALSLSASFAAGSIWLAWTLRYAIWFDLVGKDETSTRMREKEKEREREGEEGGGGVVSCCAVLRAPSHLGVYYLARFFV